MLTWIWSKLWAKTSPHDFLPPLRQWTNSALLTLIETFVDNSNNDIWDGLVNRALFTYHSTAHESTDFILALLVFG